MKQILIIIIVIAVSIFIGWQAKYIQFYSVVNYENSTATQLADFMDVSGSVISDENFSCGDSSERVVGKIFSQMVGDSMAHEAVTLTAGCTNSTCSISYDYCKPWQTTECGSRVLVYEIDESRSIKSNTIKCLDLP